MPQQQVIERKARRTATTFTGTVTCKNGTSRGVVKDLSPAGICFQLFFDIDAKTGQEVSIESEELGRLTGIVHWYRGDRIGIRLLHFHQTAKRSLRRSTSIFSSPRLRISRLAWPMTRHREQCRRGTEPGRLHSGPPSFAPR